MPQLPKGSQLYPAIYIGVDPGASGGMAALYGDRVVFRSMPGEEWAVYHWFMERKLASLLGSPPCYAIIEEQTAGGFQGSSKGGVAKLYGNYMALRMALVGNGIQFYSTRAVEWHRTLGIPPRKKTEERTAWKQRLKAFAEELFPQLKITLATADALLIAEYCRRRFTK